MLKDHSHAIEILSNCLPYFNQAKDFDFINPDCLYFSWRSKRFKLNFAGASVEEVKGTLLEGTEISILMTRVIKMCLHPLTYQPLPL
jgi:hypothetical protein